MDKDKALDDFQDKDNDKHSLIAMHTMITVMRQKTIQTEETHRNMLRDLHSDAVAKKFTCCPELIEEAATLLGVNCEDAAASAASAASAAFAAPPSASAGSAGSAASGPGSGKKRGRAPGVSAAGQPKKQKHAKK